MSARGAFPLLLGMLCLALPALADGPVEFRAGDSGMLARADATRLFATDEDLRIVLVEQEGFEIALRLTALDRSGADIGVGRVILIGASERREISLRTLLQEWRLDAAQLRVEALRGQGRVEAMASTSDGAELRFAPEQEGHVRRRPVRLKSTDALIDDALASGTINEETAMVYRVYSLFSDTRLPEQFRGVDREASDSLYLIDVLSRLDSFSPETQALLLPFFAPPAYAGSWDDPNQSAKSAMATPPPCQILADPWKFVDSPSGVVRVWYRYPDDALKASAMGSEVDANIWPEFRTLMQRTPVTDQNVNCNGGSPAFDIYIVDAIRVLGIPVLTVAGQAVPYQGCSGNAPPMFILIKRTAKNTVLAHEIFHAFHMAFPTVGCVTGSDYRWWAEGSATWAEDFIYKGAQDEHPSSQPLFAAPEKELDLVDGFLGCDHCYSTYLLPFFVHRKTNSADFVRAAWQNCATQPALEAVDKALSGGFKEVWPEFALRNWNRDPIKDYRDWDSLQGVARSVDNGPEIVRLQGSRDRELPIPVNLPRVSAMYKHFDFRFDDNIRTVAFWNGITKSLSKPDEYKTEEAAEDQKKGGYIRALIKIRGQDWKIDDWTNKEMVPFCRDRAAERIDELVVIISNSEFADRGRRLRATNMQPLLWASNMGCWKWKGQASADVNDTENPGARIVINTTATFTSFGGPAPGGVSPFLFYSVEGTETWRVSGNCSGDGTLPIAPGLGFLMTYNFTPPGGTKHRGYAMAGIDSRLVNVTCEGKPAQIRLPPWVFSDRIEPPLPDVAATGEIVDGYTDPEGVANYTWSFTPQRE